MQPLPDCPTRWDFTCESGRQRAWSPSSWLSGWGSRVLSPLVLCGRREVSSAQDTRRRRHCPPLVCEVDAGPEAQHRESFPPALPGGGRAEQQTGHQGRACGRATRGPSDLEQKQLPPATRASATPGPGTQGVPALPAFQVCPSIRMQPPQSPSGLRTGHGARHSAIYPSLTFR